MESMSDDLPPSLRLAQLAADSQFAAVFRDYLARVEMFHRITGSDRDVTFEALQNDQAWEAAGKEWDELSEDDKSEVRDRLAGQLEQAARVGGQMTAATLRTIGQDEGEFADDSHAPDVVMTVGATFWLQGVRPDG
jgi:hypothetical protein